MNILRGKDHSPPNTTYMNIRTILIAGSLCLLTLSPLQATTPAPQGIATVESKVADQKIDQLVPVETKKAAESRQEAASDKAIPAAMDSNVTLSVGTIIIILLLVIILL